MKMSNVYRSGLVAGAVMTLALGGSAIAEDGSVKSKITAQEYERNFDDCLDGMGFVCKKELLTEEDAKKIAEIHAKREKESRATAASDDVKKKTAVKSPSLAN